MRLLDELVGVDDPAWPTLRDELQTAEVPVDILPVDTNRGRECLYRLQVTARPRLGALALHTGGVVVEHAWLRVLGGGQSGLVGR